MNNDITLNDLRNTSVFRQAEQEVAANRNAALLIERQQRQQQAEHRQSTIDDLKRQITAELHDYDALSLQVRQSHGRLHILQQRLDVVVGNHIPIVPDGLLKLHLPKAFPGPMDPVYPTFPSGQVDVMSYQQSRRWPV